MPAKMPASDIVPETGSQPTQKAFKPASTKDLWSGVGIGLGCFIAFAFGGAAWLNPGAVLNEINSVGPRGEYVLPFFLIMLTFPLFLIAAGYFFWQTWRWWRDTRTFEQGKQKTTGVITQLWVDPPKGTGKKYCVGYQFSDSHKAFQEVHSRVYNRLAVGETVKVEYVPDKPQLSRLDLRK
ncbi:MAG: DUF3592 domain-containing protein [Anaerolineae bacterium]|nr:DUF3592 domain-containing protein [Anaerolineae bacterium]